MRNKKVKGKKKKSTKCRSLVFLIEYTDDIKSDGRSSNNATIHCTSEHPSVIIERVAIPA